MTKKAFLLCFIFVLFLSSASAERIPYSVNLTIHRADEFLKEKKFQKAIKILEEFKAKKGKKTHYLIYFMLGNCYTKKRKFFSAINNYKHCIEKNPKFCPAWTNIANCYYELKKYKKAACAFLKAYELSKPKDLDLMFYSALSFFYAKEIKKAESLLKKLVKNPKPKLEWKEALANLYLTENRYRSALPIVEELSEKSKDKKKKKWQEIRLYLYINLNMKKEAFSYLKFLLKEYPLETKWWKGLAHFYLNEKKYKLALVALLVKGLIKPLSSEELKVAANLFMMLNVPDKAAELYEKLIREKATKEIEKQIIYCYLKMFKPKKALEWISLALKKKKDYDLLALKGEILYQLEDYEKAARVFQEAAKFKKDKGHCWIMAGYSWLNANNLKMAKFCFKKALKYKKSKLTAQKILAKLEN